MSRELEENFELSQIWIRDPSIGELADENARRAKELLELNVLAIPIHAIVTPENELLSIYTYSPSKSADDYLEWLQAVRERWESR